MGKLIYLASPYTHKSKKVMFKRFRDVCRVAATLFNEGHILFVPIAMSHPLEQIGDAPTDWKNWRRADLEILDRCDEVWVVMLEGWKESVGVTAEIRAAKRRKMPVKYIDPNDEELKANE